MTSRWTDVHGIMRDLSVAQGRRVPLDVEGITRNRPAPIIVKEETEEEFFTDFVGGGDNNETEPELHKIKEMLKMIQGDKPESESEEDVILQVTKLNPYVQEFIPRNQSVSHTVTTKPRRKRRQRNIAIQSLLTIESDSNNQIKLLKPDHFLSEIKKKENIEVTNDENFKTSENIKVTNDENKSIAGTSNGIVQAKPAAKILSVKLQAGPMFKKKAPKNKTIPVTSQKIDDKEPMRHRIEEFTPSPAAVEHYKAMLEKSKMRAMINEDIWQRAERDMKAIDQKRLLAAAAAKREADENEAAKMEAAYYLADEMEANNDESSLNELETTSEGSSTVSPMNKVKLAKHRHELFTDCIVCEVLCSSMPS